MVITAMEKPHSFALSSKKRSLMPAKSSFQEIIGLAMSNRKSKLQKKLFCSKQPSGFRKKILSIFGKQKKSYSDLDLEAKTCKQTLQIFPAVFRCASIWPRFLSRSRTCSFLTNRTITWILPQSDGFPDSFPPGPVNLS